ncbi:MAG: BRCT domain-containing protein, partial [Planctomycetota bacterium]
QDKAAAEKLMQEEIANLMIDRENARREKNEAKDEINNIKGQFRLEKIELEGKLEEVLDRVAKIKNPEPESPISEKIAEAPNAPDGQVVFVDFPNRVAYINIGRESGVSVGQKFSVFRFGKKGVRSDKGEIEVKKVLDEMSIVAITQNLDTEYPIDIADQIVNEVFDVTKTQYFTFAGRLVGRYSNEEVAKMIEELGWKVTQKTDVRTSYIIIGKDYESHPNYIDGLRYDIEVLREIDILRLLGKD